MLHTTGIALSAEVLEEMEVTAVAHGLAAEATHHDSLTELETDDDNVAPKSPTIVPCLVAVTITVSQFHVKKLVNNDCFIISIKILKTHNDNLQILSLLFLWLSSYTFMAITTTFEAI